MSTVALPFLARALAVRSMTLLELSARSGVHRNTLARAARGRPISTRSSRRVIDALDQVPVSDRARELGLRLEEAPTRAGGDSS
jgi:hypothetical protein